MLSEQDKKEMIEDAHDPQRKEAFAKARKQSLEPMSWADYFSFLKNVQNLFPGQMKSRPKIEGNLFKL